jgi:Glycosyl transferase family 11
VSQARKEKLLFKKYRLGRGHQRPYSLGAFNVHVKFAKWALGPKYQETTHCRYDPGVYTAQASSYFIGYWQTEKYFDEALVRKELSLRLPVGRESERVGKLIKSQPSAFVHVRRTDYLHPSNATVIGNMGMDYYNEAIAFIKARVPKVHFFVFSDDPAWCRETFSGDGFTVVGHNWWARGRRGPGTEHEDLWLMSQCDHAIIPNSTFGWWGAWLNPEKNRIAIAPKHWYLPSANVDARDIVPERWTKI